MTPLAAPLADLGLLLLGMLAVVAGAWLVRLALFRRPQ